jgi:hypothetical protein
MQFVGACTNQRHQRIAFADIGTTFHTALQTTCRPYITIVFINIAN